MNKNIFNQYWTFYMHFSFILFDFGNGDDLKSILNFPLWTVSLQFHSKFASLKFIHEFSSLVWDFSSRNIITPTVKKGKANTFEQTFLASPLAFISEWFVVTLSAWNSCKQMFERWKTFYESTLDINFQVFFLIQSCLKLNVFVCWN